MDEAGPLVAICHGPRCHDRYREAGTTGSQAVAPAIRSTSGGVLVRCGCLGRCSLAAVALIGWRYEEMLDPLVLTGMQDPRRLEALADWLPVLGLVRLLQAHSTDEPVLPEVLVPARVRRRPPGLDPHGGSRSGSPSAG